MELIIELLVKYGWQAVVVAVVSFFLVECIKPLARKVIGQKNVRHTLYWVLSYAFALGLSAGLAAILGRFGDWLTLFGSAAIVVGVLAPVISNVGFWDWIEGIVGKLWSKIKDVKSWKFSIATLAKTFNVDLSTLDTIATKVEEEYKALLEGDASSFFASNTDELILNIKQKLAGFVDNSKLQEAAEGLFNALKDSWVQTDSSAAQKKEA